jgi:hypothetical protein
MLPAGTPLRALLRDSLAAELVVLAVRATTLKAWASLLALARTPLRRLLGDGLSLGSTVLTAMFPTRPTLRPALLLDSLRTGDPAGRRSRGGRRGGRSRPRRFGARLTTTTTTAAVATMVVLRRGQGRGAAQQTQDQSRRNEAFHLNTPCGHWLPLLLFNASPHEWCLNGGVILRQNLRS